MDLRLGYNNAEVKPGDVIYSFESGKMECLSEINPEGYTYVLLKSLNKNTKVKFSRIDLTQKKELVLVLNMLVEEETTLCAGWVNMQEVKIVIDPLPVEKITLSGKTIYKADKITVMAEE